MKSSVHFIYCPQSGTRLLTATSDAGLVPLVIWNNGSMHAVGVGLTVSAASAGSWCRDGAREIATYVAT